MERWLMVKVREAWLGQQCVFASHHICCIVVYLKHLMCKGQGLASYGSQQYVFAAHQYQRKEIGIVVYLYSCVSQTFNVYAMGNIMHNVQWAECSVVSAVCSYGQANFHLPWLKDHPDDGNLMKFGKNTFQNLEKEISQFGEIHITIWTNTTSTCPG